MRPILPVVAAFTCLVSSAVDAQTPTGPNGGFFPHRDHGAETAPAAPVFPASGPDAEYDGLDAPTRIETSAQLGRPLLPLSGAPASVPPSLSFDVTAIRDLPFGLTRVDDPALLSFLEFYATEGRARMTSWLARAGRYRALIEPVLIEADLPPELFWVVAIESNFDPAATSRVGAAGLWQFMRATGRQYGLQVDRTLDERRDPLKATRAAADYFKDLYETFGSWPLALAAYNAGHGHVRGELREGNATDFWELEHYQAVFSSARRYALRAITVAIVDRNRAVFGYDAVVPHDPWRFDTVDAPPNTRLSLLAEAVDMSAAELLELNPSLVGHRTPDTGQPWPLRIPADTAERFVERYDRLAARYGNEHTEVVLRFGETIGDVAAEFGLPERVVRSINGIAYDAPSPYGATVLVPGTRGRSEPAPDEVRRVIVPQTRFAYADRVRVFYRTRSGDSLNAVAEHFEVDPFHVAAWNDIDPNAALISGLTLQLFIAPDFDLSGSVVLFEDDVQVLALGSPEWHAAQADAQEQRTRHHVVRPGDTVMGLASRYGVRSAEIVRWNDLGEEAMIFVGQRLVVGR